jgi:phage protein D
MVKRALFDVEVAGTNITTRLKPVLISLRVVDKAGTHSDTADLEIDDTQGQIIMPQKGDDVTIALGWETEGLRVIFRGTVDEVRSKGGDSSGRRIFVTAKGMDTTGKPKEGQQRHWDNSSIETILRDAAAHAGIPNIEVDPSFASIRKVYFEMRDESFVHMGERLAREVGGNFRVTGDTVIFSKRNGNYQTSITAEWGVNLHSWDISPQLGRPQFNAVRSRWYDMIGAGWQSSDRPVELSADAIHSHRFSKPHRAECEEQNDSDAATSERDAGEGSVQIEGNTEAIPDGLCIVSGTRVGVDGSYRIEAVTHTYSSSGFVTALELKQPDISE